MKQLKKLSVLVAGSMVIGLLLGASVVQAQEAPEVCLDGDTVTGLRGLTVLTESYSFLDINVDFRYETGYDAYGSDLDSMPFQVPWQERDALSVVGFINGALTSHSPVPDWAGQSDQNTYYVGVEKDVKDGLGAVGVIGGANYTGEVWGLCKEEGAVNCLFGAAILQADQRFTYAILSRWLPGSTCDGSGPPPDSDFIITPGITGSWFDVLRSGEGFAVEVIGEELAPELLAYFYTYDDAGNQMWLIGNAPIDGDTAVLPMFVTSGAMFGPAFNPDDVDLEEWGTITFNFTSCGAGTAAADPINFDPFTSNISRLTYIAGLACP
jgi:hypothetical protein